MSLGCQLHLHHDAIDRRQQVSTKLDGNRDLQDEQHGRPLHTPLIPATSTRLPVQVNQCWLCGTWQL
jgi:hypothetical protein